MRLLEIIDLTTYKRASQFEYKKSTKGIRTNDRYNHFDAKKENNKRWREKNRGSLKRAAHNKVYYEIKKGTLLRGGCEVCGEIKAVAHHRDYSRPLDVTWFCLVHHGRLHTNKLGRGVNK